MPDINLIHNTELGEQERAERERQRRRLLQRQQFSQPGTAPKPPPWKPATPGLFERVRTFLRALRPRPPVRQTQQKPRNSAPKILRAERIPDVPKPAPPVRQSTPPPKPAAPASRTRPAAPKARPTLPSDEALDVNLVPADMMARLGTHDRFVALGLVALIAVLSVTLLVIALSVVQTTVQQRATNNQTSITEIDQRLAALDDEKSAALAFHNAALQGLTLLDQHVYWTKFFSGLEQYTADTVYFRSVNADRTGRLSLTATGADFRSVSRQLLAFAQAKDFVQSVSITAASLRGVESSSPLVDFTVTIALADGVFLRTATGPATFTREPTAP